MTVIDKIIGDMETAQINAAAQEALNVIASVDALMPVSHQAFAIACVVYAAEMYKRAPEEIRDEAFEQLIEIMRRRFNGD